MKSNTQEGAADAGGQREAVDGGAAAAADTDRDTDTPSSTRPDHLKVYSLNGPPGLKVLGW